MDIKAIDRLCEDFLRKTMDLNDIPGLIIGVAAGNEEWIGAAGVRDMTDKDPLQPGDVFHCASVSKLLTSTAVMKLVEGGVLSLEDRLCDLIPDLEIRDDRWKNIRLYQMLSHTSGIGDVEDYHWEKASTDPKALGDYVHSDEVADLPLLWEPGEGEFRYSNIAYEMLGFIAAEKTGMSYEDFIEKNVLKPAGMEDSTMKTFSRIGVMEGEECPRITGVIRRYNGIVKNGYGDLPGGYMAMALPHEKREDRDIVPVEFYPYNREHGPSSTLTSTVSDLLKLARYHTPGIRAAEAAGALDHRNMEMGGESARLDGSPASDRLDEPPAVETYRQIINEYDTVPNNGEKMGLGWFMREKHGYRFYGHEGTDDGFRASLWLCPELDVSIAVVANLSGAPVKRINKKLFEELLTYCT